MWTSKVVAIHSGSSTPSNKVLLVASDGIQYEALIGLWDVSLCVALLVGKVHLTHHRHIVLSWLLHHLFSGTYMQFDLIWQL